MARETMLPPGPCSPRRQSALPGVLLALSTLLAVIAFIFFAGCGWQAPPPVTIAGIATNTVTATLVALEEAQGIAAIDRGEDPEATVVPRWAPFWSAWKVWVAAHGAWADAFERGASDAGQAEAAARAALCAAQEALPPEVPREVAMVAGIACAVLPSAPVVLPVRDAGAVEGGPDAG